MKTTMHRTILFLALLISAATAFAQTNRFNNVVITGTTNATGLSTYASTYVQPANALGAGTVIDVTKFNTVSLTAPRTFTFSATPATRQVFFLEATADGTARVITLPANVFSFALQTTVSTVTVPASGKLLLTFQHLGSDLYNVSGDPSATTGTGSYVLATSPTLVTPNLGTPASITLTNATGLPPSAIVAGTLNASITLGENFGLIYDPALSADGKYSGIVRAGTAGTALAFGDLVYLAAADSRWELADADSATTSGNVLIGICVLAAAADGDPTTILLQGFVRADTAFPAMTISAPQYISATAGDITGTAPSTTGQIVRRVGFAWTADELYFNPSMDSGTAP